MKKSLLFLTLAFVSQVWGQDYTPTASEVTLEEAQKLFQDLRKENEKMEKTSECFQRAHMWSLRADRVNNLKTEKVFIFLTRKFQMQHVVNSKWGRPITWWFHVAPAVRVNGELMVMDATFTNEVQSIQSWSQSLMKNPEECIELTDFSQYVIDRNSQNSVEQCYYTTTPQYTYAPIDIGLSETKGTMNYNPNKSQPANWQTQHLKWALESYSKSHRKNVSKELGM